MQEPAIVSARRLKRDLRTEICIIGAGITGLSTAYLATREGREVVVIDSGAIADGETARTTAHLTQVLDHRYFELERLHGARGAKLAAQSHAAAIERMESIVRQEQIACGFARASAYLYAPRGQSVKELEREFAAARRAGILGLQWSERAPLLPFETGRCLHFPDQAQFHPLRYLRGLVEAIQRNGGLIVTNAHASKITPGRPGQVVVKDGPTIVADEIVMATNTPVHSRLAMHAKQSAYRTFVIGVEIPRGSVPQALYYDTLKPYHYVRVQRGDSSASSGDLLIVGGEDHPTGKHDDAATRWSALERWTRERFPMCGKIAHRWSGQVFEPHDGLAFIGQDGRGSHLSIVTGASGSGMTYGMMAATLITDRWSGRKHPAASLFDPARKIRRIKQRSVAAGESNANDNATTPQRRTLASIHPSEGAVIRRTGHAYAVYRDEQGSLSRMSAKCTHLGCEVAWNSAEKSWDCPCHGSRFDRHGKVVTGPAIDDLRPVAGKRRKQ
ncbi:MAG: FAD-dependent oxidoreductase [Candidatus Eisenbacteria bacterium]